MNDNLDVPNPALREAATQVAFSLTLTRNQISVLDAIAHGRREVVAQPTARAEALWVPISKNLQGKGLLAHQHSPDFNGRRGDPSKCINDYYRLTRAGWLMHDLLAEAGMVVAVTARRQRRLVA